MIIKTPVSYDFSHWRTVHNFADLRPFPYMVFTKATEGNYRQDPKFVPYFQDMQKNGIFRGAYHFHRKNVDPVSQANYFCDFIRPYITQKDLLALDVEEGGETAAQLKKCLERIQFHYPNNLLLIYSRANLLNPIYMTVAEKDFFRKIKVWTAGYPLNPDSFASPPPSYIPDQTKYGEVWMWQYTEKGVISGVVEGSGDCNWLHPKLVEYLGNSPTPPQEPIMEKFEVIGSQGLNLRSGPGTSYGVIKLVVTGSYVWGTMEPSGWIKGTKFQEPGKAEVYQNFYCSGASTLVKKVTESAPQGHVVEVFVDGVSVFRQELN